MLTYDVATFCDRGIVERQPMKIEVRAADLEASDAIVEHVNKRVHAAVHHWEGQITRVEAHLHDDNSKKAGSQDKRCVLEVRMANHQPMVAEDSSDDLYEAITGAAKKLGTVVQRKLEKLGRT